MLIKLKRGYYVTTASHHKFRKYINKVSYTEVTRPKQIWVSDIPHIGPEKNLSYFVLITDAFSKRIVRRHQFKT